MNLNNKNITTFSCYVVVPYNYYRDSTNYSHLKINTRKTIFKNATDIFYANDLEELDFIKECLEESNGFDGKLQKAKETKRLSAKNWTLLDIAYGYKKSDVPKRVIILKDDDGNYKNQIDYEYTISGWLPNISEGEAWAYAFHLNEVAHGGTVDMGLYRPELENNELDKFSITLDKIWAGKV